MRSTLLVAAIGVMATTLVTAQTKSPAAEGFARLKALEGDWIDVDGAFSAKGKVAVTYRVTGAGNTVVETFPAGTPHEMVTVYHLDGDKLTLTHYCTSNTQPKMTSAGLEENRITFDYAGGSNIDPSKTSHMHNAAFEFVSDDEIKATWVNWKDGKADHSATFRVVRRK